MPIYELRCQAGQRSETLQASAGPPPAGPAGAGAPAAMHEHGPGEAS